MDRCRTHKPFNEGSDARIAGRPHTDCPYPGGTQAHHHWRMGWLHCQRFWGADRPYWDKPAPLPEVLV